VNARVATRGIAGKAMRSALTWSRTTFSMTAASSSDEILACETFDCATDIG